METIAFFVTLGLMFSVYYGFSTWNRVHERIANLQERRLDFEKMAYMQQMQMRQPQVVGRQGGMPDLH